MSRMADRAYDEMLVLTYCDTLAAIEMLTRSADGSAKSASAGSVMETAIGASSAS